MLLAVLTVVSCAGIVGAEGADVDLERLSAMLSDSDVAVRKAAIRELQSVGEEAVPLLVRVVADDADYTARWLAVNGLSSLGSAAAVPALVSALQDEAAAVREASAAALGKLMPDGEAAVTALAQALLDSDANVRAAAANALAQIGPAAKAALPLIMIALEDSNFKVQVAAQKAHRSIDSSYEISDALPTLLDMLTLGVLDNDASKSLLSIARMLKRVDPYFAGALSEIGPELREYIDHIAISPSDLSLTVVPPGASGVVLRDEDAKLTVEMSNRSDFGWLADLKVALTSDRLNEPEVLLTYPVRLGAKGKTVQMVEIPTDELRYWRIEAWLECGSVSTPSQITAALVVDKPANYGKDDPDSFFGAMMIQDYEAADRLGVKFDRLQAYWQFMSRADGYYDWNSLDRSISEARKHGIGVIITIRPEGRLENELDQATEPQLVSYRRFVRDVVERYRDQLLAVEILNEPDLTYGYYHRDDWPTSEAARLSHVLHREAYKIVKEIAPDLPVVGMSVSGSDIRDGLPFTESMLSNGADQVFDIFGGHPYTNYRFIQDFKQFEYPVDYDLRGRLERSLDLMEKYGLPRRLWGTELGWAWLEGSDPLGDAARKHAAVTAQALIETKSVPGLEKLLLFSFTYPGYEQGYSYGLINTMSGLPYPLPAAGAYATAARLLDKTDTGVLLDVHSGARAFRFDSLDYDRTVVAVWGREADLFLAVEGIDSLQVYDILGRSIATGPSVTVELTENPVYLSVALSDADVLVAKLEDGVYPKDPVIVNMARMATLDSVRVWITNRVSKPVAATIEIGGDASEVLLKPGSANYLVTLASPVDCISDRSEFVVVSGLGFRSELEMKLDLIPVNCMEGVTVDGDLSEVADMTPIVVADRKYVLPPDPNIGWTGPDDLSARVWFGWNDTGLYMAAKVTDDVHVPWDEAEAYYWNYDSLQVGMDPDNDSTQGYVGNDFEIGVMEVATKAPGEEHRSAARRTVVTASGVTYEIDMPVVVRRDGEYTLYEFLIPWERVDLTTPRPGKVLRINFMFNESDGAGRAYWMGLTDGIATGKYPGMFQEFVLLP